MHGCLFQPSFLLQQAVMYFTAEDVQQVYTMMQNVCFRSRCDLHSRSSLLLRIVILDKHDLTTTTTHPLVYTVVQASQGQAAHLPTQPHQPQPNLLDALQVAPPHQYKPQVTLRPHLKDHKQDVREVGMMASEEHGGGASGVQRSCDHG